jgi:7-carboxy-7-deazaguanine synthase
MRIHEILSRVKEYDSEYVCVTGGEPLGQKTSYVLMRALIDDGYTVSLETNGSFSVRDVPPKVIKVIDLKCPDSGESGRIAWENIDLVKPRDQFKFVIGSRNDFDWACTVCEQHRLQSRCHVLFSPVFQKVDPSMLAQWILTSHVRVTLQLQLHKQLNLR